MVLKENILCVKIGYSKAGQGHEKLEQWKE